MRVRVRSRARVRVRVRARAGVRARVRVRIRVRAEKYYTTKRDVVDDNVVRLCPTSLWRGSNTVLS